MKEPKDAEDEHKRVMKKSQNHSQPEDIRRKDGGGLRFHQWATDDTVHDRRS